MSAKCFSIIGDDQKICMFMYIIYFLCSEGVLQNLDETLLYKFKSVCEKLGLPLQPPEMVNFFNSKKVTLIDEPTGRAIDYTLCATTNANALDFPSIVCIGQSPLTFGKLQDIFTYRERKFVIVKKIKCIISCFYGLKCLSNCVDDDFDIVPIPEISRPLALARSGSDIWILNHHK